MDVGQSVCGSLFKTCSQNAGFSLKKKIAVHFKSATFGDPNWFSLLGEGSTAEVRRKGKKVKTNAINFTIVTL